MERNIFERSEKRKKKKEKPMKNQRKLFQGLLIVFLILIMFGFGLWLGEKSAQRADSQYSKLINKRYFDFMGTVTEISDHTLTLSVDEQSIKISIRENAKVRTYEPADNELPVQGPREILFEHIEIGDIASIFTEQKQNQELEGTNIYIHYSF